MVEIGKTRGEALLTRKPRSNPTKRDLKRKGEGMEEMIKNNLNLNKREDDRKYEDE